MTTIRRCAIYTRKSSEEGLDQEFNSLDAQREACEAYVKSQAHEGWQLIHKQYNDGGFSGGNLERPAMQELLRDVEKGEVDVIVVYKVDRLTRSLSDFARMVEMFDRNKISFVAVTQHFNTTTSMGRLTLNVLLSFAQFEREVTGERIRDKIAASKRKGMWMGGVPPLGYDVVERKLVVNPDEAERVRHIFERYLALGSATALRDELHAQEIRGKAWVSAAGNTHGGAPFSHGALYRILQNRTYRGEVAYRGEVFPGQHEAIVSTELWDAVNTLIAKNRRKHSRNDPERATALLEGVLFDDAGHPMSPSYAVKKGRRYHYYVSTALTRKERKTPGSLARVPREALDELVTDRMQNGVPLTPALLQSKIRKIVISKDAITFNFLPEVSEADVRAISRPGDAVTHFETGGQMRIHMRLQLRGGERIIVGPSGEAVANGSKPNPVLIRNLLKAHRYRRAMQGGAFESLQNLAEHEECTERQVRKLLPLAYLAPDIADAILHGTQPPALELRHFTDAKLPIRWDEQRRLLGFAN